MDLSQRTESLSGQCNICGWSGTFLHPTAGREGLHCGNCASSSRNRAVVYVLGSLHGRQGEPLFLWESNRREAVLESSARGTLPLMFREKFDYWATEYDARRVAEGTNPRAYADFQKLSMNDNTFDAVIASDVFEHVRRDGEAFREILRVLKPQGSLILTVPYDHDRPGTIVRIDTSGETDVNLLEPEYHGGGGHTITYRNYGRDLLTVLRDTGFAVTHHRVDVPGFGISKQSVIVGTKGDHGEIVHRWVPPSGLPSLGPLLARRLFLLLKFNAAAGAAFLRDAFRRIKS